MKIEEERDTQCLRLALTGDLDVYQAPALKVKIMSLVEDSADLPPRVVFDCGALNYVDSAGLGAIIDAHRRLERAGRPLRLTRVSEKLYRVFKFARLVGFLDIETPHSWTAATRRNEHAAHE